MDCNGIVAVALVRHGYRWLMLQRSGNAETGPWLWSFPGGRPETLQEDAYAATCRELREETGLTIWHLTAEFELLIPHHKPDRPLLRAMCYIVEPEYYGPTRWCGEPDMSLNQESCGFGWFTVAEIGRLVRAGLTLNGVEPILSVLCNWIKWGTKPVSLPDGPS